MAKPAPETPHSDTEGVNRDARVGRPGKDPALGSSEEAKQAEDESAGRPEQSSQRD